MITHGKRSAGIVAVSLVSSIIVGCGGSGTNSRPSTSTGASTSAVTSQSPPATHPTCESYCEQAGVPAGERPPGYPCPQSGCLACPSQHCAELLSSSAEARSGLITVSLRCDLSSACQGALLLCIRETLCSVGKTEHGAGGRLAASNFDVPAGQTQEVAIAATELGRQFASLHGGYGSDVLVDMPEYGIVKVASSTSRESASAPSTAAVQLTTSEAPPSALPGNPVASCDQPGTTLLAGTNTTCGFASAVYKAWQASSPEGNVTVEATSPATGQRYSLSCSGGAPVVCSGGSNASVVFF